MPKQNNIRQKISKINIEFILCGHEASISIEVSLEKTNFSVKISYQLQIPSWLAVVVCVHFPVSLSGLDLCRPCYGACEVTVCSSLCL